MKLGLEGENGPIHLEAVVETDLARLPPLLKRFIENKAFVREVDRTYGREGHALARVVLGERRNALNGSVDVLEFNLHARHQRVPYLLAITRGQFFTDFNKIEVKNLSPWRFIGRTPLGPTHFHKVMW